MLYHAAGAGVVLDTLTKTQSFYLEHTDDIICLAVSRNPKVTHIVATGRCGLGAWSGSRESLVHSVLCSVQSPPLPPPPSPSLSLPPSPRSDRSQCPGTRVGLPQQGHALHPSGSSFCRCLLCRLQLQRQAPRLCRSRRQPFRHRLALGPRLDMRICMKFGVVIEPNSACYSLLLGD